MNHSSLTIIIPVYISHKLHLDFTRQTLESIISQYKTKIVIINNYCAPEFTSQLQSLISYPYSLITNPKGNVLASAWNLGLNLAFGHNATRYTPQATSSKQPVTSSSLPVADYCLIINNDIIFHPLGIDNLVHFAKSHPEFLLWSASEWSNLRTLSKAPLTNSWSPHPHFSCFMLSKKTVDTVGYFDENFTMGYFEDNDYHTRILVKKGTAAATDSAKFYHYGSRTVTVDDNLTSEAKYHYQLNRKYFENKWGIDIHGKAFNPPEDILKLTNTHNK